MLEAANLGLGSTWVMHFNPLVVEEEFELDDNIIPVVVLVMGYPAVDAAPSANHSKRKDIKEISKIL